MKNTNYVIAIDADGVLCDFDKKVKYICNIKPNDRSALWSSISYYNDNVEPFFESLDKMSDADKLLNFIKDNFINYFILTACGFTPKDAADQKRRWFAKNYGKDLIVKVVSKSPDKAQFANPYTILIDDRTKSIEPWIAAGGIGILHKNADDTIRQLQEICSL